jgi:hypothetical protein
MGHNSIDIREVSDITLAVSDYQQRCSYFGQMGNKTYPQAAEFFNKLLEKYKLKYADHNFYKDWCQVDLHVVLQMWGNTSGGWEGIGGAAMSNIYTVVVENPRMGLSCIYYHGKLAYILEIDDKYREFIKARGYHFPGINSCSRTLTVIYKNEGKR